MDQLSVGSWSLLTAETATAPTSWSLRQELSPGHRACAWLRTPGAACVVLQARSCLRPRRPPPCSISATAMMHRVTGHTVKTRNSIDQWHRSIWQCSWMVMRSLIPSRMRPTVGSLLSLPARHRSPGALSGQVHPENSPQGEFSRKGRCSSPAGCFPDRHAPPACPPEPPHSPPHPAAPGCSASAPSLPASPAGPGRGVGDAAGLLATHARFVPSATVLAGEAALISLLRARAQSSCNHSCAILNCDEADYASLACTAVHDAQSARQTRGRKQMYASEQPSRECCTIHHAAGALTARCSAVSPSRVRARGRAPLLSSSSNM